MDVKAFTTDLLVLSGFSSKKTMDSEPKGGRPEQFFMSLANKIGLQRTLEVALVVPNAYQEAPRPMQAEANQYLGGMKGVVERIYEDQVRNGEKDKINLRIVELLHVIGENLEQWASYRKHVLKFDLVTDMVVSAAGEN